MPFEIIVWQCLWLIISYVEATIVFFFGLLLADIVKHYSFNNKKLKQLSIAIIIIGILVWTNKRDALGYIGFNGYSVYYLTFLFYPAVIYFYRHCIMQDNMLIIVNLLNY